MSIDMEQFHGVFFDESQEHLETMEHLLMELQLDDPDPEDLNSIFRAAHSIKGGSGIFGFDALTGLTHVMENLLDRARKNTMQLTEPVVDVFLETVDLLKIILDAYRNDEALPTQEIEQGIGKLETILSDQDKSESVDQSSDEDQGFGFFETDDQAQRATEASVDTDKTEVAIENDIEGFGLFDTEPEHEDESEVSQSPDLASSAEEQGEWFGVFDPKEKLPVKPAAQAEYGFYKSVDAIREDVRKGESEGPSTLKGKVARRGRSSASGKKSAETSSIRVDTGKIDSMVNLVGELVITQSMLAMISDEVEGAVQEKLQSVIGELQRNTREIQESVMSMRMLPMHTTFNRFPRVVRDLSNKLGKKVDLKIEGGSTEIDKGMIEKLVDPLTHLVRNSIDHGVETTEQRIENGKSDVGSVTLRAEQKGSSIVISIIDDGAGLNRNRILAKASENGLDVEESMSDSQVWQLIFQPGFSTAAEVTDVSGRGVGMDVVRRNIEEVGGRVEIQSTEGKGSAFHIFLPLTLAIVDGICVTVADQIFVIPLANIIESIQPTSEQLKLIGNDQLLWIREQYWPLVFLEQEMELEEVVKAPDSRVVVLVESGTKRFGLVVDDLIGQQQVVIKSLEQHYKRVRGVAGATIMGDGSVAMILDIESLSVSQAVMAQETQR